MDLQREIDRVGNEQQTPADVDALGGAGQGDGLVGGRIVIGTAGVDRAPAGGDRGGGRGGIGDAQVEAPHIAIDKAIASGRAVADVAVVVGIVPQSEHQRAGHRRGAVDDAVIVAIEHELDGRGGLRRGLGRGGIEDEIADHLDPAALAIAAALLLLAAAIDGDVQIGGSRAAGDARHRRQDLAPNRFGAAQAQREVVRIAPDRIGVADRLEVADRCCSLAALEDAAGKADDLRLMTRQDFVGVELEPIDVLAQRHAGTFCRQAALFVAVFARGDQRGPGARADYAVPLAGLAGKGLALECDDRAAGPRPERAVGDERTRSDPVATGCHLRGVDRVEPLLGIDHSGSARTAAHGRPGGRIFGEPGCLGQLTDDRQIAAQQPVGSAQAQCAAIREGHGPVRCQRSGESKRSRRTAQSLANHNIPGQHRLVEPAARPADDPYGRISKQIADMLRTEPMDGIKRVQHDSALCERRFNN